MEYKINDLSNTEKEIEITLTYDEIKDEVENKIKERIKKIEIPGFRKGKAPASFIKKMYGDSIEYEVTEKISTKKFFDLAKEIDIKYIDMPTITAFDFKPASDISFKVKYEVLPAVEINNYKNIEIKTLDFKIEDNLVEDQYNQEIKNHLIFEDAENVGDEKNYFVDLKALRLDDEKKIAENAQPQEFSVDLDNDKVDTQLVELLRGKKEGDEFDYTFEPKIKEDDEIEEEDKKEPEKLDYRVTVKKVKKYKLPELNEEFFKMASRNRASSAEEFRKLIESDITDYYEKTNSDFLRSLMISKLIENNPIDLPKSIINNYIENVVNDEIEHQKQHKHDHEHEHHHHTKEQIKEEVSKTAENDIKWSLIREEIVKKENIEINDDDVLKYAEKEASKYGLPAEKLVEYYKENAKAHILHEKLFKFLEDNNNILKLAPKDYREQTKKD